VGTNSSSGSTLVEGSVSAAALDARPGALAAVLTEAAFAHDFPEQLLGRGITLPTDDQLATGLVVQSERQRRFAKLGDRQAVREVVLHRARLQRLLELQVLFAVLSKDVDRRGTERLVRLAVPSTGYSFQFVELCVQLIVVVAVDQAPVQLGGDADVVPQEHAFGNGARVERI